MIYHNFDLEKNLLFCVFHGKITRDELNNYIDELLKIRPDERGMRGLVIFAKNMTLGDLSYRDIYAAGKKMRKAPFRKNGKNAIISTGRLGYTIGKMYQSVTEIAGLDETKVFKWIYLNEATEWLGVSHLLSQFNELVEHCESIGSNPSNP